MRLRCLLVLCLGLLALSNRSLWAHDGEEGLSEDSSDSQPTATGPVPAASVGWYYNLETDLDQGGAFNSTEYRLKVPVYGTKLGEHLRLGFQANYRFHQLQTSAEAELFDHDLHRISLNMVGFYRRDDSPWFFWGSLAPGLASDFDADLADGLTVTAIGSLGYMVSEDLSIAFGAYAGQSFGEYAIYPAIGVRWAISDHWQLNLTPPNLTLTWEPLDRAKIHLSAFPGGGSWAVKTPGGRFDEVGYRDIRVGLGVDYEVSLRLWASAWAGVNLFQKLEYRQDGHIRYESDLDDSAFVFFGLRYEIW